MTKRVARTRDRKTAAEPHPHLDRDPGGFADARLLGLQAVFTLATLAVSAAATILLVELVSLLAPKEA